MANSYFTFKEFSIHHDKCAMKVTTDACLFGAWVAEKVSSFKKVTPEKGSAISTALDIGTGTGLLSLMLLQKNPSLKVDAIEIDKDAALQAKENIASSPWNEAITIINTDVKKHTSPVQYDIIISNPPFYERELKGDNLKKNTAHHDEGLLLSELLQIIKQLLNPSGSFYLLLPYKRLNEAILLFCQHELAADSVVHVRQTIKHNYFRVMIKGKMKKDLEIPFDKREISVWNEEQQYTTEFINLLKDYYLYL